MLTALFVIFAAALAALYFDASYTAKGVAAGIAEEANWLVRMIYNPRPTFAQLLTVEVPQRVALLGIGFLPGPDAYPSTWKMIALTVLAMYGLHNVKGAREWKWMFAHPGQKLPVLNTVWQKIVGFWG